MKTRRFGLGMGYNQYDPNYHLSRPVRCVVCGVQLHKTLDFVFNGYRCEACYQAALVWDENPEHVWR